MARGSVHSLEGGGAKAEAFRLESMPRPPSPECAIGRAKKKSCLFRDGFCGGVLGTRRGVSLKLWLPFFFGGFGFFFPRLVLFCLAV